jgi:hypothetical protein
MPPTVGATGADSKSSAALKVLNAMMEATGCSMEDARAALLLAQGDPNKWVHKTWSPVPRAPAGTLTLPRCMIPAGPQSSC